MAMVSTSSIQYEAARTRRSRVRHVEPKMEQTVDTLWGRAIFQTAMQLLSGVKASTASCGEARPVSEFDPDVRHTACTETLAQTSCQITMRIAGAVGTQFGQITTRELDDHMQGLLTSRHRKFRE
jgi:hypothetical protein